MRNVVPRNPSFFIILLYKVVKIINYNNDEGGVTGNVVPRVPRVPLFNKFKIVFF